MFIAVLSVKCKVKSYVGIHRMVLEYWDVLATGLELDLISERQLRDRLKKSAIRLEALQNSFLSCFLAWLNQAWSDVAQEGQRTWRNAGGLQGVDKETTWCVSKPMVGSMVTTRFVWFRTRWQWSDVSNG